MKRAAGFCGALVVAMMVGSPLSQGTRESDGARGRNVFAAPEGVDTNPGTKERPLSLRVALSAGGPVRPGDTLWLRGGTYHGSFESTFTGDPDAPITVRQYPGERAVVDSAPSAKPAVTVTGSWTVFRDLELMNSDTKRRSMEAGPWPSDLLRGSGVLAVGRGTQLINLVIHDMADGIGIFSESQGSSAYGNIVFNNGWSGPDRSHGHGIYTQNETGPRAIEENILFNQFGHGVHAYGSEVAHLDDILLRGNIAFNNGMIGATGPERDLLLGGGRRALRPIVVENVTYGPGQSNIGYAAGCSEATVAGNYFVGNAPLIVVGCDGTIANNLFVGPEGPLAESARDNRFVTGQPAGVITLVRPNRHEAGRAHIAVYNWDGRQTVEIDPAGLLQDMDTYEVRDVQNYSGSPVASGIYHAGARISLPLSGLQAAPAVGDVPVQPRHTAPEFAVFVLRRLDAQSPE